MSQLGKSMKKGAELCSFGLATGVLIAGCGGSNTPLPSGSFPTSSIFAYMKAVQDESGGITTTVQLRDGNASTARYLYLSSGDTLYASVDKPPQQYFSFSNNVFANAQDLSQNLVTMRARDLFVDYFLFSQITYGKPEYYMVGTPGLVASSVRAYVDLERSGYAWTGPSSIDLPGGFHIQSPVAASNVSRAASLMLSWDNVDATTKMTLNVAGICDGTSNSRYSMIKELGNDTGTATLNSADYFPPPASGIAATANCLTAFILQRARTGGVSTNFAFGGFTGVQQRTVQFNTTP